MHAVVADSAGDQVVAGSSHDAVVASVAEEPVFALVRPENVVAVAAAEDDAAADVFCSNSIPIRTTDATSLLSLTTGAVGVEPTITGSKPVVLPLHYAPMECGVVISA